MDLTIDTHAGKAISAGLQEDILELTLAVAGDRREDEPLATGCLREDLIDNLFRGLRADASTTFGTVGLTDPGVQDAQVVVDLGDGANGRPRILGCRLLFNGNGRRETDDCVNGRFLLVSQELARVAGEAFDVASLPLGVQGVEGERRLARTGDAGEDHQGIARDGDRDVLEIMFARTLDEDVVWTHQRSPSPARSARTTYAGGSEVMRRMGKPSQGSAFVL